MSDRQMTVLLQRWRAGDRNAEETFITGVFPELQAIATSRLRHLPVSALCPGEVVSEAYLRLRQADVDWNGLRHFLAIASRLINNVIVDHARAYFSEKRGGGAA